MFRFKFTSFLICFSAIFFISVKVAGQVMVSPTGKPSSLVICSSGGTFSLQIANTTGSTMTGAVLTVDLPPGCLYIPGSISGATESNISNLELPVFDLPPIPNNSAHSISFLARIICGYNNTTNFNYLVSYNSQNYSGFDTPLQNFYYPEPVITLITNATAVIPVNQTITRNITIEQQGINSSLDTLIILDEHTADIQVISVSLGVLHPYIGAGPVITDTIILTGSDLPGANGKFDAGEIVIVGETVKLLGCTNGESTIKAGWGCLGEICNYYSAFPSVSPAAGNPAVSIAFTANRRSWGFTDNSGFVEFTVANTGTGAGTAFDLTPLAGFSSGGSTYYPNADWVNEIDSFSVNGNYLAASFNYAAGAINGQYAHYTTLAWPFDPDGPGIGLDDMDGDGFYDDLPPGKTLTIRAHCYYDWPEAVSRYATGQTCGSGWTSSAYQAFRFGYAMKNQCHVSSGVNWIPNSNVLMFMTYNTNNVQVTVPSDLYDNIPVWFEQTVVTATAVNNEGCPNDSVVYKVVLPPGVMIATGYIATFKGVSMGIPQIIGDTAKYFLDKSRILTGGLFRVPVVVKCALPHVSTGTIHAELKFWCDRINYKSRYFTYWCADSPLFGIQCPVSNCPDPSVSVFSVERQTLGWTNERCTTRVVRTTPGIRLDHAFSRDTLKIRLCGKLHGWVDSLFFQVQHNAIGGGWGNQFFLEYLTDTLCFYDAETASWHTCYNLSPQIVNGSTSYLKTYFGNLNSTGNCLDGLTFSDGDSLVYVLTARVRNIAQSEWRTVGGLRAGFQWQDLNQQKKCNDLGCNFIVNGSNYPLVAATNYQQIVLNGCTSFQYEGMIYRSLDICGGDIAFPNEVRPFNVLDTMTFILPEGFSYQTGTSIHSYYMPDGTYRTETIADPQVITIPGSTRVIFIRDNTWGFPSYYDCGNDHDRIRFNAIPSCKVQGNYSYTMDARGRYQFYADRNGIYKSSTANVAVTYTPPLMSLIPLVITAEGREDTVSWDIRICNSRAFAANNNWLAFENSSGNIIITSVKDITIPLAPVNIPYSGYGPGKIWFQSGNFSGSECRVYRVKAIYNSCSYDSILIRHGYNCSGYPMNPSLGYVPGSYSCAENTTYIYLDPKDVSLNLAITAPVNPVSLCDTLQYSTEVTNSQLSYAYDLKFTVVIPPGVTILPGSSSFNYPYTSGSWSDIGDPVNEPLNSNRWVYHLSSDAAAVSFLKGVDSIPSNGYRIRFSILTDCGFTSGTSMRCTASAANACGDVKERTSYTPPIHIDGLPTSVNLYVINTQVPGRLYTCSAPSLVKIKVINLGPSSVSQIEKLGFNIDDAFDYVTGSLNSIHNGPSGISSNTVTGGIRYINFAIQPNLAVNDSIVFTFNIQDVDPASLICDTIVLETTTLLVAAVTCQSAPGNSCLIQSITSSVQTSKPVIKDILAFGSAHATSTPTGTTGEMVTIFYHLVNAGTDTLHLSSANIFFFYDANGNGFPDESVSDSLFCQTLTVPPLLPGDSLSASATFVVPAAKTCRITGAVRLPFNGCICTDIVKPFNQVHFTNAGPDHEFCSDAPGNIGLPATSGYSYIWLPPAYLDNTLIADPVFFYPGPLASEDTTTYILYTTRSGNCLSQDTVQVTAIPHPSILNPGTGDSICSAQSATIIPVSGYPNTTYTWTATGSSPAVSGYSPGSGTQISQVLFNSGISNEQVSYHVIPVYKGCTGDTAIFPATVHPVPGISFNPSSQIICGNNFCNISLQSGTAGTDFTWNSSSDPWITGHSPGSGSTISQLLYNNWHLPGSVSYSVTPSANGCNGIPAPVSVVVNPLPAVIFAACENVITTTDAKPFQLKGALPHGGMYSGPGVDSTNGVFHPSSAGTGVHLLFYRYTNYYGCSMRDTLQIEVLNNGFSGCGSLLTDIRDGKTYPTLYFGTRCWMTRNLDYGTMISRSVMQRDNCLAEKYCYLNSSGNCTITGGLYQWDELMKYDDTGNSAGLCPPGWHVASRADWADLFSVYLNESFAGSPLKFSGFSGFYAQLSGASFSNADDQFSGFAGFFWTSTRHGSDKAWAHAMNVPDPSVSTYPSRTNNAFSVRCVKD